MSSFRRASHEPVNAFLVGDRYLFKHFFDGRSVFARLKPFYNTSQYRFEIPVDEFAEIRAFLDDHGYGLVAVDAPERFVVVVRKYTTHPENIFKESVIQHSIVDYNCFIMTTQSAVDDAIDAGAIPLVSTDLENPFD